MILLATYNGEQYLSEQLDSIIDQSYRNWTLLIRDDGSTDNTLSVINKYLLLDDRLQLFKDNIGSTGSAERNFNLLCSEALKRNFDYYFFSDQDDIWHKEKINVFINKITAAEQANKKRPLLLYSDLTVIDEHENVIHDSFMCYQGLKNENNKPLETLLTQNYVTGCAMMVNQSLLKMASPFPDNIIMHDWWLALCTSTTGKIIYIDKPLIDYRQHSANVVGAKGFWSRINPFVKGVILHWIEGNEQFLSTITQSKTLYQWLAHHEQDDERDEVMNLVNRYSLLLSLGRFKRIARVFKLGVGRQNLIMQIAFLIRVFFMSPNNKND
ncbi:MAG: glycosyltransferase family 2 protein [gamma proteobacterium symbiont of Lucinoma myriamae]|nr:glycosyltransferase family 2 protein [gamma proteobacterium symbiont of Lucinoma myriamae]MCU7819534.1 glycosyltransferase family 2 protein [gamma proteobacterium symbiont of Lucinoma myriamae]